MDWKDGRGNRVLMTEQPIPKEARRCSVIIEAI